MKHFTRQLYRAIQHESRKAERDWQKASEAYAAALRLTRRRLPPSARAVSRLSFHDGIVRAWEPKQRGGARIVIDATHNPWGPRGTFRLDFVGDVRCSARGLVVGDWWLYDEYHLHARGFALHVLLQRSSLVVAAADVTITPLG